MLGLLWKWRALIIFGALGLWVWRESVESDQRRAVEEAEIQASAEAKRVLENALREVYETNRTPQRCQIDFDVELKTFGQDVTVELRVGEIGTSFPLEVKRASGGNLHYENLCPGKYFIAIGDEKQVSTTPVRDFEFGQSYTSTVELTSGTGNMGSSRRERL
jgi:hypothetical protein